MTTIRVVETDADFDAYVGVWNAITPEEPASPAEQQQRRERDRRRLYLLAEREGVAVGCGFAGPSQSEGRGALSPRVLPAARRRGLGTSLLRELAEHLTGLGFEYASAEVDGDDAGSLGFARSHGFEEVNRQVEQVKAIGAEPPAQIPAGVGLVTIADHPELLGESYDLALEGYADMATPYPVSISLDEWLDDEATLPEGSFVALSDSQIVGYTGLCRRHDGVAEDGLTVVSRAWRRRGLASALKRAKLAWAAANGIGEIVTWTQRGNEGMRAVNEALGYVYRRVSVTVRAPLPLRVEGSPWAPAGSAR